MKLETCLTIVKICVVIQALCCLIAIPIILHNWFVIIEWDRLLTATGR